MVPSQVIIFILAHFLLFIVFFLLLVGDKDVNVDTRLKYWRLMGLCLVWEPVLIFFWLCVLIKKFTKHYPKSNKIDKK